MIFKGMCMRQNCLYIYCNNKHVWHKNSRNSRHLYRLHLNRIFDFEQMNVVVDWEKYQKCALIKRSVKATNFQVISFRKQTLQKEKVEYQSSNKINAFCSNIYRPRNNSTDLEYVMNRNMYS